MQPLRRNSSSTKQGAQRRGNGNDRIKTTKCEALKGLVKTVSESATGVSVRCAYRCHTHPANHATVDYVGSVSMAMHDLWAHRRNKRANRSSLARIGSRR